MDQRRWEEVRTTFDELADLDNGERQRRLAALGASHPDVRDAVAALLRADADVEERLKSIEAAFLDPAAGTQPTVPDVYNLSGRTLLHFSVGEPLGSGGMGIVYGAQDLRLGRAVALKFLTPDLAGDPASKNRFLREARAMAALDHPNVCAIHEVAETDEGIPFFAMPLYAGETLQTRLRRVRVLTSADASYIARQIAEGLASAHNAGTVHRDLKPGNVMLLPNGSVKILDFGVAKARDQTSSLSGSLVGTIAYMSPEQLRGDAVDARTDLWSLGVVLLEMVTGTRSLPGVSPFRRYGEGSSAERSVPASLRDVLQRLLEESLADRYQTAAEVVEALKQPKKSRSLRDWAAPRAVGSVVRSRHRRLITGFAVAVIALGWMVLTTRSGNTPLPRSLAVLPCRSNLSAPNQRYLGDLISEDLIAEASARSLFDRVIAWPSVSRYRDATRGPKDVGTDLGVEGVLYCDYEHLGTTEQLRTQLVDVRDGALVWTRTFVRDLKAINAPTLPAQAMNALAGAPGFQSRPRRDVVHSPPTRDLEALNLFQEGQYFLSQFAEDAVRRSIVLFREAIAKDPSFALPHVGLARAYALLGIAHGRLDEWEAFPAMKEAAQRALALDPNLGDAHALLGSYELLFGWNWNEAERQFQRALTLNENSAVAHEMYAFLLSFLGRQQEAFAASARSIELSPVDPIMWADAGVQRIIAGRFDEALPFVEKSLELAPNFHPALWAAGVVYAELGENDRAIEFLRKADSLSGQQLGFHGYLGYGHAIGGDTSAARRILQELKTVPKWSRERGKSAAAIALVHMGLGERDSAFKWLDVAIAQRSSLWSLILVFPPGRRLRPDERYNVAFRSLGLALRDTGLSAQ